MRYKKFFLIPVIFVVLVLLYTSFINGASIDNEVVRESSQISKSGGGEVVGVGQAISVKVTRATNSYMLGLVTLPAYVPGIGNIATLNTIFFWSLYTFTAILTSIFVIMERRNVHMAVKSPFTNKPNMWMKVGKALGIGALFALVGFLISGDASSLPLGLLVAYLEFRMA